MPPDCAGREAQHEAQCNGQDDHRDLRLSEDRSQENPLQQGADGGHDDHRANACQPERQPPMRFVAEGEGHERAEHHHVALREIDLLGGLVDQDETESDEPIDTAIGEAADNELKNLQALAPAGTSHGWARSCGRPLRAHPHGIELTIP